MPRTRSLAWSELKIGILAVTALILASVLIFLLGGDSGFFWQQYSLKTTFGDVAGLKAGAPVRVAGVEVGAVSEVGFVGDRVEVVLRIKKEHQPRITTESRAILGSVSLLGESAIDISASSRGTPIPEWGYIPSGPRTVPIAEVGQQASEGLLEATELLRDVRNGKGTIGKLVTDEAVYREMSALLQSADRLTNQIAKGQGTLGRLTNDPRLYDELRTSVADLNVITARIRNGEGSLGKLLNDPAMASSLAATTQNLETLTGKLNRGEGTAGKLLNETALYDRLDRMIEELRVVAANLNSGQGTAGQLLRDKALYENMNQTVTELRALFMEIKKDPKKYLNVKVSLF
jgi:phospholipid/cholesterol/gamma-HCH transport system substrate-binding protein